MRVHGFKWLIAAAGIAGSLSLLGTVANAETLSIDYTINGLPLGGTLLATDGGIGATGGIAIAGGWTISATATGQPLLAPPDLLLSNTIDTRLAGPGSTLVLTVTETGVNVTANSLISSFTSNVLTLGWTVTEVTKLNGVTLHTAGFAAAGTATSTDAVAPLGFPVPGNVLQEIYTIVASGAGSANLTIDISAGATPLPAALPLFGSVLGGGLLLSRFRKKKAA